MSGTYTNGTTLYASDFQSVHDLANGALQPGVIGQPLGVAGLDAGGRIVSTALIENTLTTDYFVVYPESNPEPTSTLHYIHATTTAEISNHFPLVSQIVVTNGHTTTGIGSEGNNLALYTGTSIRPGAGNCWVQNGVLDVGAGVGTLLSAQWFEFDNNNNNMHYGDTGGLAGVDQPFMYCFNISGASNYRGTSAQLISGSLSTYGDIMWNRGITFVPYSVRLSTIADYGNPYRLIEVGTNARQVGIDLSPCSWSVYALAISTESLIVGFDGASTPNPYVMMVQGSNGYLHIGGSSENTILAPAIAVHAGVLPAADNTLALGSSSLRFSIVYSESGVVTTSDIVTKTDVKPLDPEAAYKFVRATTPIAYKKAQVGEVTRGTKTIQTHAKDENGAELFDEVPETDAALLARAHRNKGTGKKYQNPDRETLIKHVPRMESRTVEADTHTKRAGARTHLGFDAGQVANNGTLIGIAPGQFAAHVDPKVTDPTSSAPAGLREQQMVPAAYAAIYHLGDRIDDLSKAYAKIEALADVVAKQAAAIAELQARGAA